ncbi:acyl-CoA dehydrogenase family protein [Novosphingobium colocasiae]
MNFNLSDEQQMLRDMLESFLRDRFPFEARRAQVRSTATESAIWSAFANELQILGTSLPENVGGLGGGPTEKHDRHGRTRQGAFDRAVAVHHNYGRCTAS